MVPEPNRRQQSIGELWGSHWLGVVLVGTLKSRGSNVGSRHLRALGGTWTALPLNH